MHSTTTEMLLPARAESHRSTMPAGSCLSKKRGHEWKLLTQTFIFFAAVQIGSHASAQWSDTYSDPPLLQSISSPGQYLTIDENVPAWTKFSENFAGTASFAGRILEDHRNYYDFESFRLLAGGFLVGAAFANTSIDEEIRHHFQSSIRGGPLDTFLHANKGLGEGRYTLPVFATAWVVGNVFDDYPTFDVAGRWGERNLRSFLVGAPPLVLAQVATGGSRPGETDHSSHWRPFHDNNGVSGHSFMAALPFINAAKMTERRWLKSAFYLGSLAGPLSRINDDAHYTSQAGLGWCMAFVAATAVDRTQRGSRMQIRPHATNGSYGALLEFRY